MTPQALKASILQLAIQGKLVPQHPEEGTAEDLYQQIQAEKQRLIAEGSIKREKALAPIKEDEIPFEIPETWKWVRLGELCNRFSTGPFGSNLHKEDYTCEGTPVVNPTNIQDHCISTNKIQRIGKATLMRLSTYMLKRNDIILARRGDLSKCAIISEKEEGWLCGTGAFFLNTIGIDCSFFIYLYSSTYTQRYLLRDSVGTTMHNLNQNLLNKLPLPLPPLEEQKRIVAKIEEMLPLVERYGEAYEQLQAFNKRFPDDLRKSILQEAIQGKLVPQRPEEGTAEDLYQQIQAEKQRLIASGSIKKEKPLPPIEKKDLPFDIPETWKWVRLHDLSSVISKGTTPRGGNACYSNTGIAFLRAENVAGFDKLDKTNLKFVTEENHHTFLKRSILKSNDILITIAGTLGRTALVTESDLPLNANQAVAFIRPIINEKIALKYIIYALNAPEIQQRLLKQKKVTAIPNLTLENIDLCCIPLPSLDEQKRIVAAIEEILALCEHL